MEETVFSLKQYEMKQQKDETIRAMKMKKLDMYQSDFGLFKKFCEKHFLVKDFDSLELYLHELITQQQVRLSTFNRRFAGVKYWLVNEFGL